MKTMKFILLTTLFTMMSAGIYAQTTTSEYRYATKGGYDQGEYKVIPFNGLTSFSDAYTNMWISKYTLRLLIRKNNSEDSIAAAIIYSSDYDSHYCIPHPLSDSRLFHQSVEDFPVFWNSHNEAFLFQLIQTSIWGDELKKRFENQTIVRSDMSIANFWEHEPTPNYAEHWGEFDYFLDGRKPAYNALAKDPPLYVCNEKCKVIVKFSINEKGLVESAKVVDDVYFREYDGSLIATNTTSACVREYLVELTKQNTYYPNNDSSTGYVLYRLSGK
jgi:hypothetical protein